MNPTMESNLMIMNVITESVSPNRSVSDSAKMVNKASIRQFNNILIMIQFLLMMMVAPLSGVLTSNSMQPTR